MSKKYKRLSCDELRAMSEFENYTDDKLEETIANLEKLAILFYQLHQKNRSEKERLKSE